MPNPVSQSNNAFRLPYFRKRLWVEYPLDIANGQGSWTMLRAMLLDRKCWQSAVMLDPLTGFGFTDLSDFRLGLDPPGFKLRAASGFEAADFFVAGNFTGFVVQLTHRLLDMEQGTNL